MRDRARFDWDGEMPAGLAREIRDAAAARSARWATRFG